MHYLVIDRRFSSPVHVFLEDDPRAETGFPVNLSVRSVTLEAAGADGYCGIGPTGAVGQDPYRDDRFRLFGSDGAAAAVGYGVVEPRFVGPTWAAYSRVFGFGARKVPR